MVSVGTHRGKPTALRKEQRDTHLQVIGDSRQGKSRFLQHLIRNDILDGNGVCVIDPHGELYEDLVAWLTHHNYHRHPHYQGKIHLLDPRDLKWSLGFNPLAAAAGVSAPEARTGAMLKACAQIWGGKPISETPLLAKCLRMVFYTLAKHDLSLTEGMWLTTAASKKIQEAMTSDLENSAYARLWEGFGAYRAAEYQSNFDSTTNRLIGLTGTPTLNRVVGQTQTVLDLRQCMDEGHIILVNLNGEDAFDFYDAQVIGAMLLSELNALCRHRDKEIAKVRPFYCYIDECAEFLTADVAKAMYQTAKYGLHFVLSHQTLEQLREHSDAMFRAVWGGAQSKVVFRVDDDDTAEELCLRLFRKSFDLMKTVSVQSRHTTVGHRPIWLESESEGEVASEGENWSSGSVESVSAGQAQAFANDGTPIGGGTETSGDSSASVDMSGGSRARSMVKMHGWSQTLAPIIKEIPELERVRLEEQIHEGIVKIRSLPARQPIVLPQGGAPVRVRSPFVSVPRPGSAAVRAFIDAVCDASPFVSLSADIDATLADRERDIASQDFFRSKVTETFDEVVEFASAEPASLVDYEDADE